MRRFESCRGHFRKQGSDQRNMPVRAFLCGKFRSVGPDSSRRTGEFEHPADIWITELVEQHDVTVPPADLKLIDGRPRTLRPAVLELQADPVALARPTVDPPSSVTVKGGGLLVEDFGIAALRPVGHREADRVVPVVAKREARAVRALVGPVQVAPEDVLDRRGTAPPCVLGTTGDQRRHRTQHQAADDEPAPNSRPSQRPYDSVHRLFPGMRSAHVTVWLTALIMGAVEGLGMPQPVVVADEVERGLGAGGVVQGVLHHQGPVRIGAADVQR